jgi:hypothetical protein
MTEKSPALRLPAERNGQGSYLLTLQLATPPDEAAIDAIAEVLDLFSAAANRGAFPVPEIAPALSRLSISPMRFEGKQVWGRVEAQGVDLRSLQLLRSMADRLSLRDVAVVQCSLSTLETQDNSIFVIAEPADDDENDMYPGISTQVRFNLTSESFVDTRMRRCLVELNTQVEAAHVARLADWIDPWFGLVEAAAYALPVGRATQVNSFRGDVALFDEQSIEITVNRYEASEYGWCALVNLLESCWHPAPVIATVTIE